MATSYRFKSGQRHQIEKNKLDTICIKLFCLWLCHITCLIFDGKLLCNIDCVKYANFSSHLNAQRACKDTPCRSTHSGVTVAHNNCAPVATGACKDTPCRPTRSGTAGILPLQNTCLTCIFLVNLAKIILL